MASLASSKKRKRKYEDIKAGTIFYVKWNMEDGTERYFKAVSTGKNKGGKFEIKYTQDGSTEMRKISTIDNRSKTLISQEIYNNTISAYPPKKTPVGEDYQVRELPQIGTNNSHQRALSMVPLTDEEIRSEIPLTNEDAVKDMDRAGKSQQGWGRKTRRRRKKKRRKSRKKPKKRRRSKKRKVRKNKKTRKRKQKGRGANICQMYSDPNTRKDAIVMAMNKAKNERRNIPEGRRVGLRVASAEAHHYCQEMNDWNDNYKCDDKVGSCVLIKTPEAKKAINDRLRMRGYK